jgi:hypothetical protein
VRVIVVNAKGGQAEGPPLARWLRRRKPLSQPLVALISECDGPKGDHGRIADALTAAMPKAQLYRGTKDHGAREVAVLVLGASVKVHAWDSVQLTQGHGWSGGGQDRWAMVVRATFRGSQGRVRLHSRLDDPARHDRAPSSPRSRRPCAARATRWPRSAGT